MEFHTKLIKIILFLIFISVLLMPAAELCLAQEKSSLFPQDQYIKQKFYPDNGETDVIAKDLNAIENNTNDANLMFLAKEVEQDHIIAQKNIFLINKLAAKEAEKENLAEQNRFLIRKMLSLISEKQALRENLTKENQALTQKAASLVNMLAEREAEKESLARQNQALEQEMNSLVDRISDKEAGKKNLGQKKKIAAFLMDLSKKEMSEKGDLRNEIANLKKTIDEERTIFNEKLGAVYIQAKKYNEAIGVYEEELAYNPNNPIPAYYLGLLYKYSEKNPKKAVQYLRKYIELAPKGEYIKKAKELIKILE